MPLNAFLRDPENWIGHAHDPVILTQFDAFMSGIGATKRDTRNVTDYYGQGIDAQYSNWHVFGYKEKNYRPLLHISDDEARTLAGHLRGVNLLIAQEYNPALGITQQADSFLDDAPWLGDYAQALTNQGYPEVHAAEILSLLRVEGNYGRDETYDPATGGYAHRPHQLLLDNIRYANLLVTAKHLKPADRRRYMRLDIPVADLPALLTPDIPYTYVATLYRQRTPYVGSVTA